MAVKVLVAEDDALARYGLCSMLRRHERDIVIAGEAENGKEALELALSRQPDMIITDVRMPVMDGIELMRAVKAQLPDIRLLFLSSYSDFEYMREVIRFGAVDYMLKLELNEDKLISTILQACADHHETQGTDSVRADPKDMNQAMCIRRILTGEYFLEGEIASVLRQSGIDLPEKNLLIVILSLPDRQAADRPPVPSAEMQQRLTSLLLGLELGKGVFCAVEHNFFAGIISLFNSTDTGKSVNDVRAAIRKEVGSDAVLLTAGVTHTYESLPSVFHSLVSFDESHFTIRDDTLGIPSSRETFFKSYLDQLRQAIETGDADGIRDAIGSIIDTIRKNHVSSSKTLHSVCFTILYLIDINITRNSLAQSSVWDHNGHIMELTRECRFPEDYIQFILRVTEELLILCPDPDHHSIAKAKEYIAKNYTDSSLTLEKVASVVGLSSSYFSHLFGQTCNVSFVDYLTQLRINKACQLLAKSGSQVQEIASLCGYPNPFYFSKVFKKVTGATPLEWRNEHRTADR